MLQLIFHFVLSHAFIILMHFFSSAFIILWYVLCTFLAYFVSRYYMLYYILCVPFLQFASHDLHIVSDYYFDMLLLSFCNFFFLALHMLYLIITYGAALYYSFSYALLFAFNDCAYYYLHICFRICFILFYAFFIIAYTLSYCAYAMHCIAFYFILFCMW